VIVMYIPFFVFGVLLVCKCELYRCHRESTQLQLNIYQQIFDEFLATQELRPNRLSHFNLCQYYYVIDNVRREFTCLQHLLSRNEKSVSIQRFLKGYFKKRTPSCVEKFFQKARDRLEAEVGNSWLLYKIQ